jgi:hypothetical protein
MMIRIMKAALLLTGVLGIPTECFLVAACMAVVQELFTFPELLREVAAHLPASILHGH